MNVMIVTSIPILRRTSCIMFKKKKKRKERKNGYKCGFNDKKKKERKRYLSELGHMDIFQNLF